LRLATSIQHGTVTASLILRKLSAYPRQNGLALALREIGRISAMGVLELPVWEEEICYVCGWR
jgi:TnpA family transposase